MHHSRTKWTGGTELLDTIDIDPELREVLGPFLPNLRFMLDDLTSHHTDVILQRQMTEFARLGRCCLAAFSQRADLLNELRKHADLLRRLFSRGDTSAVSAVFWYAVKTQKQTEDVRTIFAEATSMSDAEKTIWDQWVDEFEAKNGDSIRAETLAATLLDQLSLKFGAVPSNIHTRVRGTSKEEIQPWLRRILTAETVEDVFAERKTHG